jgi:hypothetical protein
MNEDASGFHAALAFLDECALASISGHDGDADGDEPLLTDSLQQHAVIVSACYYGNSSNNEVSLTARVPLDGSEWC